MTGEITTVPLRGVRGMIADKMVKSLTEAAQLTHHATAGLNGLEARKAWLAGQGTKVSVEDLLMEAVTSVIARHRGVNGTVEGREIRLSRPIHLSVAMQMPGDLLVAPAIFDAQNLDAKELSRARHDLAARAKINGLTASEMTGGTFTISNLGLSRVHYFTPILNAPQIAILGVGCARERAVATHDGVEFHPFIGLSLTFDHRAIDGAPAAAFLSDLCETVEGMSGD